MKNAKTPLNGFRLFLLVALLVGIFFRFYNLDYKVFWKDEAYTALRISGYTKAEFLQNEFDGKPRSLSDLAKYQQVNPGKGVGSTISSLAQDAPQHSPLYFVLARFMTQLTGDPIWGTRLLSAFFSLLVFPALYWLCLELFESPLVGWVAIALIAVSPFHVFYAQEARQYSLWAAITLLSSATLLRAMRLQTPKSWIAYTLTVILGLYAYLFAILVSFSHGIYALILERFRLSKTIRMGLLANLIALIAYSPWIWVVIDNSRRIQQNTGWMDRQIPPLAIAKLWARNFSYGFFDLQFGYDDPFVYAIPFIFILVAYSFYFLVRRAPIKIWLFVVTLAAVPFLCLALPDLFLGGSRSIVARYIVPSYLGIQLAVAYLLGTQLTNFSLKIWQQKLWQILMVTVITSGVISCAIMSQADTWWGKSASYYDPKVAAIVNQTEKPLIISSDSTNVNVLSLGHKLEDKVTLQLMTEPALPQIPPGYSDVFLYNVSDEYQKEMAKTYKFKQLVKSNPTRLWKLEQ